MKETDELIDIVHLVGSSKSRGGFDKDDARRMLCGLSSYRGFGSSITSAPKHFFDVLFSQSKSYNNNLFPFDPIDLRDILEDNVICHSSPLVLFSPQAASSLIKSYKSFLMIDTKNIEDSLIIGGAVLCSESYIDVTNRITGIMVTRQGPEKEIRNIVSDINPSISVHNHINPPGMERIKVSQSKGKKQKYIVNLPALKIVEEIVAENEYDALKRALSLRWDRHPDSKEKRKPARYSADYWLDSGFWGSIVKKANSDFTKRKGQNMNLNWYKNIKADASSASQADGYGANGQSGEPELFRNQGEKKMVYYEPGENSMFNAGDRVRSRGNGLAHPQNEGKIVKKKNNKILVRWDNGKDSEFDLNEIDTNIFIERV